VLIVSCHRLGTAEIEDAIDDHLNIVESAVVGYPHDVKGEAVYAFAICHNGVEDLEAFKKEINKLGRDTFGPIAKVEKLQLVSCLPKTRSGKFMRRILRKVASGDTDDFGDISTLLNPEIVEEVKKGQAC